jgi:hypothetical protein
MTPSRWLDEHGKLLLTRPCPYGHAQHFLVVPHADGERAALVPIFGEAS